jgi:hypothetical protein
MNLSTLWMAAFSLSETYNTVWCTQNTGMCTMCCHSVHRTTSHPVVTVFWWYVMYGLRIFFLTASIIPILKNHIFKIKHVMWLDNRSTNWHRTVLCGLTTGLPTDRTIPFWHFIHSETVGGKNNNQQLIYPKFRSFCINFSKSLNDCCTAAMVCFST